MVCLIDCDSFQVQSNGRLLRCEVGVAQYTPPELQEKNFRQEARTPNHDRFGLAVLIFHLLFMGRHPFAGCFIGKGDMLLEQAIKEFRFAYAPWAGRAQMAPPPFALPLDVLSSALASMFDRAFRPGSEATNARPTATEWAAALGNFKEHLMACPVDPGHKVPRHIGKCPWCEIMRTGGPNFFVGVTVVEIVFSPDEGTFSRLRGPRSRACRTCRPGMGKAAGATLAENRTNCCSRCLRVGAYNSLRVGSVTACGLALLLGSISIGKLAFFGMPILLVFGVWPSVLIVNSPLRKLKPPETARMPR